MGVADKIAELAARLPPEKQAEVLDFVEYLTSRSPRSGTDDATSDDAAFRRLALAAVVDDDDPVTYDLSDCRKRR